MDTQREQLIQRITQEVIKILADRGLIDTPSTGDQTAAIHAPIGTCTGDYSKFPELRGGLGGQADAIPDSPDLQSQPITPLPTPIPLNGIITANQLQEAIDASPDAVAVIAGDARLTPLASDFARKNPEKVSRGHATAPLTTQGGGQVRPWAWWLGGHCNAVNQVAQQRTSYLRPLGGSGHTTPLSQVVRDLALTIGTGQVTGGFLFVENAARIMCMVNRCQSIRAVIGTCEDAVEQGITELGANVLVLEYPHVTPRSMAVMVDQMLQSVPTVPPLVQRELADLHRC